MKSITGKNCPAEVAAQLAIFASSIAVSVLVSLTAASNVQFSYVRIFYTAIPVIILGSAACWSRKLLLTVIMGYAAVQIILILMAAGVEVVGFKPFVASIMAFFEVFLVATSGIISRGFLMNSDPNHFPGPKRGSSRKSPRR